MADWTIQISYFVLCIASIALHLHACHASFISSSIVTSCVDEGTADILPCEQKLVVTLAVQHSAVKAKASFVHHGRLT